MTALRERATTRTRARALLARLRPLRPYLPWMGGAVAVALLVALALHGVLGHDGAHHPTGPTRVLDTRSSWIPGQASLETVAAYRAVADPAEALAQQRAQARTALLAHLAALKKARAAHARALARKRYLEARRRALARYRAALRRNARQRAIALARQRRQRAKYLAALRRYHHALIVHPGQECDLPQVRSRYHCASGLLPHGHH